MTTVCLVLFREEEYLGICVFHLRSCIGQLQLLCRASVHGVASMQIMVTDTYSLLLSRRVRWQCEVDRKRGERDAITTLLPQQ